MHKYLVSARPVHKGRILAWHVTGEVRATSPGLALKRFMEDQGVRLKKGSAVTITISDDGVVQRGPCLGRCRVGVTSVDGVTVSAHWCGEQCSKLERHAGIHRCEEHV